MPKIDRYEIVVRDGDGERVARTGNAAYPMLRHHFEEAVRVGAEDGYEVLGLRINGFSTLYTLDEIQSLRS